MPKKAVVIDAFSSVARTFSFDPLCDHLKGLRWDGMSRLERWLSAYLDVQETGYANDVGLRWMISAVARAFEPGCQVDACWVLEEDQASGKSSVLRMLAGSECFGDDLPDLKSKDAPGI